MKLLLFHPGVLEIDCNDCHKHVYDLEKGKAKTYKAGSKREERPMVRPPRVPPPCDTCPKGSPEDKKYSRLRPVHWRTLAFYQQVRATRGACLTDEAREDAWLMQDLAILETLYQRFEREALAMELANQVALLYKK